MKNRQRYRAARDNLLDQLNQGFTFPLTDMPLVYDDVIPPGQNANITLPFSQSTVEYRLHNAQGQPVTYADNSTAEFISGNDSALKFICPVQVETKQYRIFAKKEGAKVGLAFKGEENPVVVRSNYLDAQIEIKIGLNKALAVFIKNGMLPNNAPQWQDFPVRLFNPGEVVQVVIPDPQEEIYYRLVKLDADGTTKLSFGNEELGMGIGTQLLLTSDALDDDIDLHICATRKEANNSIAEEVLLTTMLQIKVRASSAVEYSVIDDDATLAEGADYNSSVKASMANSGPTNLQYHFFTRPVLNQEYDLQTRKLPPQPDFDLYLKENNLIATPINDPLGTIYIKVPQAQAGDITPPLGYIEAAPAFDGNNAKREVNLSPSIVERSLLLQVNKTHQVLQKDTGPNNDGNILKTSFVSTIYADNIQCLLVKPMPAPSLTLQLLDADGLVLEVGNGEPGVIYTIEKVGGDADESKKAYFHRWPSDHPNQEVGLGRWAVGYNFVAVSGDGQQEITLQWPKSLWGATLKITATKALTLTHIDLANEIQVPVKPEGEVSLPFKVK